MAREIFSPSWNGTTSMHTHQQWDTFPFWHTARKELIPGIPDVVLSLAAPFLAFWVFCAFWRVLDVSGWTWLNKYRIREPDEITRLNKATVPEVVRAVIVEQLMQTAIGIWWLRGRIDSENVSAINHARVMAELSPKLEWALVLAIGKKNATSLLAFHGAEIVWWTYWWIIPVFQMFIATFVIDFWQYWGHRYCHTNTFLYKHVHSLHHRLYAPYCFGALYNHWIEALLLDIVGTVIAHTVAGMTVRQGLVLFTIATVKAVDDHCGYAFPWDPLHMFFTNNVAYHDIHHRTWGIKYNYSQPFFVHWDNLFGTRWRGPVDGAHLKATKKTE